MDRFYNSKRQSTASYIDIFKACRLCGSGGGYKMPIIQNITNDDNIIEVEAELKQKIKECVSILVQSDDRMPPLICELCVDKVNDFFEFREMCKSTNARVRGLLGLPPQNMTQETSEDCILGVSGPVFNSSKSEAESILSTRKSSKSKKESIKNVTPPSKKSSSPTLASLIVNRKTRSAVIETPPPVESTRSLSGRKRKQELPPPSTKKIRFTAPAAPPRSTSPDYLVRKDRRGSGTPAAKQAKPPKEKDVPASGAPKKATVSSPYPCSICYMGFTKPLTLKQHLASTHTVSVIEARLGCTPCKETFSTIKEADTHHRWHRNSNTFYNCDRCSADFRAVQGYTSHFTLKQCIPERIVADVVCGQCLKKFATKPWMDQHKCKGPPPKGGDCPKCLKHFNGLSQLRRHDKLCKGTLLEVNPSNPHLKELRPISIRVDKCDQLLNRIKRESRADSSTEESRETVYDLSAIAVTIKEEPADRGYENPISCNAVIKQEIKEEPPDYGYEDTGFGDNYSSNEGSDSEMPPVPNMVLNPFARKNNTQVETLSIISLRSIFSDKMVKKKSKKPKKKKIIKLEPSEAAFDAFNVLYEMQEAGIEAPAVATDVNNEDRNSGTDDFWANESRNANVNQSSDRVHSPLRNDEIADGETRIDNSDKEHSSGDNIDGVNGASGPTKEGTEKEHAVFDDSGKEANSEDITADTTDVNSGAKEGVENTSDNCIPTDEVNSALAEKEKDSTDGTDADTAVVLSEETNQECSENGPVVDEQNDEVAKEGFEDKIDEFDLKSAMNNDADAIIDPSVEELLLDNVGAALTAKDNLSARIDDDDDDLDFDPFTSLQGDLPESVLKNRGVFRMATSFTNVCNDKSKEINEDGELLDDIAVAGDNSDKDPVISDEQIAVKVSSVDNTNESVSDLSADNIVSSESPENTETVTASNNEESSANSDERTGDVCKKDTVSAPDADVLDLVSDSGDDCNILEDTLEKAALEEQLLLGDDADLDGDKAVPAKETDPAQHESNEEIISDEASLDLLPSDGIEKEPILDNEEDLLLDDGEREEQSLDAEEKSQLLESEETELLLDSDDREHSDKSEINSELLRNSPGITTGTSVIVDGKSQSCGEMDTVESDSRAEPQLAEEISVLDTVHGSNSEDLQSDSKRVKSKGECKVLDDKMDLDNVSDDDFDMEM